MRRLWVRLTGIGNRAVGRLRPNVSVMLKVAVEGLNAEVGADARRIVKERKRLAILAGAAVANGQHMRHEPKAIRLKSAPQRLNQVAKVRGAAFAVSEYGREQLELVGDEGRRRSHICGRHKHHLLARGPDRLPRQWIEAGECRAGSER